MKRGVSKSHKSNIFNSLNIILIALLFVELIFVTNPNILTGQPVKSVGFDGEKSVEKTVAGSLTVCVGESDCGVGEVCYNN